MVFGYFFVRPIPLPPVEERGHGHVHPNTVANGHEGEGDEEERLLDVGGDFERDDDVLEDPNAL
jgi:hypothetical protein